MSVCISVCMRKYVRASLSVRVHARMCVHIRMLVLGACMCASMLGACKKAQIRALMICVPEWCMRWH